jgi:hypothetical protein
MEPVILRLKPGGQSGGTIPAGTHRTSFVPLPLTPQQIEQSIYPRVRYTKSVFRQSDEESDANGALHGPEGASQSTFGRLDL